MNALILAAGLGERLKPVSESIPKPLLPIVNQHLIDINIKHLLNAGIARIGVNLFHKHEMIRAHLEKYETQTFVAVEEELLGTGGALLNFRSFLKGNFILYSGDVISDINLREVIHIHKAYNPVATLVLVKHHGIKFQLGNNNCITRIMEGEEHEHTYAGIAVCSEQVFNFLPRKPIFSIVEVFRNIISAKERLVGLPSVMQWYNMNSLYSYWKIHHDLLNNIIEFDDLRFDSPIYISTSSKVETKNLKGFISINDDCLVAKDVYLENTIILPGSRITSGNYRNCVLSSRHRIIVA